ncbi:MAG TPA: exo-alpha-sialidase [Actinomycetota bacterium]|nr:exo-alpha-sialidase [Actinomycetota bacterium]
MKPLRIVAVGVVLAVIGIAGAIRLADDGAKAPEARARAPETLDPEGIEEAEEQRETTADRLDALARARAAGRFDRERITGTPAPGWAGERLMNARTDDWEPALAADPSAPFVYLLATRYGEPKPCPGNCPIPHIALEISSDGGKTWSDGVPLCACKGSGQYDPIIEVVPDTGEVYALWMNGFNVVFQKSSDHGETWTDPVATWGNVSWNDKPVLAVSDDGQDVYVSWNGPTGGDPWVTQSHDGGTTWAPTKLVDSGRYFFAMDADVTPGGTVVFSESSLTYTGPGAAAEGEVRHHAFVSPDDGATWTNVVVGRVELGQPCETEGCYDDFYAGHDTVTSDADGDLVYLFDGATTPGDPQRVWASMSPDGGETWSSGVAISRAGRQATGPAAEATGDGDVRLWYAERTADAERWNIWYRRSNDGGQTWSSPLKISDAVSGADYKNAGGFLEFYGDYGEIVITSSGKTIAAWGEGFSWLGPGGVWFNRQK